MGFSGLEGDGTSRLLVVAEALGGREERAGLPLRKDAPAGGVFQKALDVSGIDRSTLTLTNIVRCRPPGNELRGMPYERAAIAHCRQYLNEAVADTQPSLILALGDIPLRELSTVKGSISSLRGFVLPSIYNIPMIATYHPSHLARGAFHLFGTFIHDVRRAHSYALHGVPEKLTTSYVLDPTNDDVVNYIDLLNSNRDLACAYDIETPSILGEVEPKDWREKVPNQIQFSSAAGTALVLPWEGDWIDAAKEILATPNPKLGWNDRLSDRLTLRGCGVCINGEQHDLMNAWAHLQPNFVSSKDAGSDEDKGVPARLMSLQACVSFYFPYEGPWKGMTQVAVREAITKYKWLCLNEDREENKEEMLAYVKDSTSVMDTLRWYGCLWKESRVMLWGGGSRQIRFIVNNQESPTVVGMDENGNLIPVKVVGWRRVNAKKQKWLQIKTDCTRQPMYLTPDHKVWTDGGWIAAEDLKVGNLVRIPRPGNSDLIHGTLLGDGCVDKRGRLRFTHCAAQKDWFDAKRKALGGPAYKVKGKDHWATEVWVSPKLWRDPFYKPLKHFIEPLSAAALAVWYCDDGCLANGRTPRISVFDFPNMKEVTDYFDREFGEGVSFYNDPRSNGGAYAFTGAAKLRFLKRIAPFMHPSMEHKLPDRFRGLYNGWIENTSQQSLWAPITKITPKVFSYRGGSSRYCITVDHPTHRFFTMGGLVENCRDADLTFRVGIRLFKALKDGGLW